MEEKNHINREITIKYPRKKLCKKCKFCKVISGGFPFCDYGLMTGKTCIHLERGRLVDSRGDYPKCYLFEKDN